MPRPSPALGAEIGGTGAGDAGAACGTGGGASRAGRTQPLGDCAAAAATAVPHNAAAGAPSLITVSSAQGLGYAAAIAATAAVEPNINELARNAPRMTFMPVRSTGANPRTTRAA